MKIITLVIFFLLNLQAFENKNIDVFIEDFMVKSGVYGLSIAISKNDELAFAKGYGVANLLTHEPITPSHQFRIASITKPLTAAAIIKLIQDGKLNLHDKVFGDKKHKGVLKLNYQKYGNIAPNERLFDIEVIHLLEHTSGNWYNKKRSILSNTKYKDLKFIHHVLAKERKEQTSPLFPGEKYKYSNFGYYVLGLIIEKKSGKTYENYMRDVFLVNYPTIDFYPKNRAITNKEVRYYSSYKRKPYKNRVVAKIFSAGGAISSAIDLVHFGSQFDMDNFNNENNLGLNKKSISLIKTPQTKGGQKNKYAKGWVTPSKTKKTWWHSGKIPATNSMLLCEDKQSKTMPKTCVAILINTEIEKTHRKEFKSLARKVANLL